MSGLKNELNIMYRGVIVSFEIERVILRVKKIICSLMVQLLNNTYYTKIDEGRSSFQNYKVHTNGNKEKVMMINKWKTGLSSVLISGAMVGCSADEKFDLNNY